MIVEKSINRKAFSAMNTLFEHKQICNKRQWITEKEQSKKMESLKWLHLIEIP